MDHSRAFFLKFPRSEGLTHEKQTPVENRQNNNPQNYSSHIQSILSYVQPAACNGRKAVLKNAGVPCPSLMPLAALV